MNFSTNPFYSHQNHSSRERFLKSANLILTPLLVWFGLPSGSRVRFELCQPVMLQQRLNLLPQNRVLAARAVHKGSTHPHPVGTLHCTEPWDACRLYCLLDLFRCSCLPELRRLALSRFDVSGSAKLITCLDPEESSATGKYANFVAMRWAHSSYWGTLTRKTPLASSKQRYWSTCRIVDQCPTPPKQLEISIVANKGISTHSVQSCEKTDVDWISSNTILSVHRDGDRPTLSCEIGARFPTRNGRRLVVRSNPIFRDHSSQFECYR